MKFYVGAKDAKGFLLVGEIVEVPDFEAAVAEVKARAIAERPDGDFRITAVNEQLWD